MLFQMIIRSCFIDCNFKSWAMTHCLVDVDAVLTRFWHMFLGAHAACPQESPCSFVFTRHMLPAAESMRVDTTLLMSRATKGQLPSVIQSPHLPILCVPRSEAQQHVPRSDTLSCSYKSCLFPANASAWLARMICSASCTTCPRLPARQATRSWNFSS